MDSLRLFIFAVVVGIPLFVFGLIPVVGETVVPVLTAVFGGWVLALELTGVPFERRGLRLVQRRQVLRRQRPLALGFGVATFVCFLIPLGAVLVMPAAVAGATLMTRRVYGLPTSADDRRRRTIGGCGSDWGAWSSSRATSPSRTSTPSSTRRTRPCSAAAGWTARSTGAAGRPSSTSAGACAPRHLGAGLPDGEAVATTAGNLPARWVIHTVGPVYSAARDQTADAAGVLHQLARGGRLARGARRWPSRSSRPARTAGPSTTP